MLRPEARPGAFFVPRAEEWQPLNDGAERLAAERHLVPPLSLPELRAEADILAARQGLPGRYLDFLSVLVSNAAWRETVASIPFERRTLLLPPCLRAASSCRAAFDAFGLVCANCGQCCIGPLWNEARDLGYVVLAVEGTRVVETLLEQGAIDCVIGVSCMPSLSRTFEQVAARGVPGLAVPLLQDGCRNTKVIEEQVRRLLRLSSNGSGQPYRGVDELITAVRGWFSRDAVLEALAPGGDPAAEAGVQWVAKSGKRWRPFLAAAVYCALRGADAADVPVFLRRAALGLECLHKASLVFDDIQDDDTVRYGEPSLHAIHGVPFALTVGLYLIGQGYRLLAECGAAPEIAAEMLRLVSCGHRDLSLGQGAEQSCATGREPPPPSRVVEVFRMKTAPAFEAVLGIGALCGGATAAERGVLKEYGEAVGIAYQIRDDLQDFRAEGGDPLAGRPSIVASLAYEAADDEGKERIADAWRARDAAGAAGLRALAAATDAERRASDLLARYREEALAALRPLTRRNLKILLHAIAGRMLGP
jgi:geranylgeranyl pyrophosphate synthase